MNLTEKDRQELLKAMLLLENPGIAAKITNLIGTPIEKGLAMLPESWNEKIGDITQTALLKSADAAIFTMKDNPNEESSNWWHKLGVAVSGGVGGFFWFTCFSYRVTSFYNYYVKINCRYCKSRRRIYK
jgi:hypothetical protein